MDENCDQNNVDILMTAICTDLKSFRKYGGTKYEYASDLNISRAGDAYSNNYGDIFLYYYCGLLKRKKESGFLEKEDIFYASLNTQNTCLSIGNDASCISLLDFAMIRGDIDTVEWLIAIGLDLDDHELIDMVAFSILSNSVEMLEWVIKNEELDFTLSELSDHNILEFALLNTCTFDMIKFLYANGIEKPRLNSYDMECIKNRYNNDALFDRIQEFLLEETE